jgi:general secretion pathway protein G
MTEKRARRKGGFTLIEVLLVVVIIGILVGVAIPRLGGRVRQAEESRAKADIQSIGLALRMYELDNGEYPGSLQGLVTESGARNWNGPYLESGLPKDPWGRDYIYARSSTGYTLKSLGADGAEGNDDISKD